MDILSGSYSHHERGTPMAGWFQVLWGKPKGEFLPPAVLNNTDGSPLTIPDGDAGDIDRICTRPTAVDLNGDGHLDIVSGNFGGTFHVFYGQGQAKYPATGEWMQAAGKPMEVPHHSDPFFVDWDGDGDQDMLSGSAEGGVFLFDNIGSAKEAKFAASVQLIRPELPKGEYVFGMDHLTGSQKSSRVFAADMNDDGKLDLLVGDGTTLMFPAEGLSEDVAREKYKVWMKEQEELMSGFQSASANEDGTPNNELMEKWNAHYEKMKDIVTTEMTGFVWVYYQK